MGESFSAIAIYNYSGCAFDTIALLIDFKDSTVEFQ